MRNPGRTFSDDDEAPEEKGTEANAEVEYAFEGFEVAFSEKVALLPAGTEKG